MQKSVFPIVLIFCLFTAFISCSNKPKRSRKPVSTVVIQPNKKNYAFGEKVSINVKTKVKNGEIKNIQLFYKNQLLKESKELDFVVENVELDILGNNSFRVVATKTDGVSNTRIKSISIISDIKPKDLTYQIINNYPHLKTSYTQGLEFRDGFLYEGTGNLGESKLLKVNLQTGNPVITHKMENKYFGEGITILNNKIYQLTYKAQKGFIYDLKSFAVLDSFTYKSEQGWGLTNDGTNLIMSDGTNHLIWLNPSDFSEIKRIQVSNNLGTINNLNELEWINGHIFANVYTSDFIIEIDPETGKIHAQINLAGILNMYRNQNDTIDYLNGIAYDKKSDRIFVTGKWWPRLFEVKFIEASK